MVNDAKESSKCEDDRVSPGANNRILAIELRYRRFGFAVFEFPKQLLDAGARSFNSSSEIVVPLRSIISIFRPSMIVFKLAVHNDHRYRPGMIPTVECMRDEAKRHSIPVECVTLAQVQNALATHPKTKAQIAAFVAQAFPNLSHKLPPERKPWIPEGWSMAAFDAIALGLACLQNLSAKSPGHLEEFPLDSS